MEVVVIDKNNSDEFYAARKGSPLVIGIGNNEYFVASDASPIIEYTDKVIYLEDGDHALVKINDINIFDKNFKKVSRKIINIQAEIGLITKGGYKHFMEKEIFHQPISIEDTILNFADKKRKVVYLPKTNIKFNEFSNIIIVACGTAYHSCMVAKYWIEEVSDIMCTAEIASEYRYRTINEGNDFFHEMTDAQVIDKNEEKHKAIFDDALKELK